MTEDERRLARLLQEVVPDPGVEVTWDELVASRRRRRRTSTVLGATAAAVVLAVAVPTIWWASLSPHDERTSVLHPSVSSRGPGASGGGCPRTEPIQYPNSADVFPDGIVFTDFVELGGQLYLLAGTAPADVPDVVAPLPAQLLQSVGEVTCQLSELEAPAGKRVRRVVGPYRDGNASYLPVGTRLRAVSGYDPSCRIAAEVGGDVRLYLAVKEVDGVRKARDCAT